MTRLLRSLSDLESSDTGGALAVGNFDGVHRGHAKLIEQLVHCAREVDGPAVVMTFDPPPLAILAPERALPRPLTTIDQRAELLGALGVDTVVAYPTNHELLQLSPTDFFDRILVERMRARALVEGPNFRFGHDRAGSIETLRELCHRQGLALKIATASSDASGMISSTRIRMLLADGDVAGSNHLLTRPYRLSGVVTAGAGRGRGLGFPTANLEQIQTLIPGHGVYAGRAFVGEQTLTAAIHVGPNPTFEEGSAKVEIHLLDWSGDLYGTSIECEFISKIRKIVKFDSVEQLRQQILTDIETCRTQLQSS